MSFNRKEAVDFLHNEKHYSRRLSAKIVDVAMDKSCNTALGEALRKCVEGGIVKKNKTNKKIKYKFVVNR